MVWDGRSPVGRRHRRRTRCGISPQPQTRSRSNLQIPVFRVLYATGAIDLRRLLLLRLPVLPLAFFITRAKSGFERTYDHIPDPAKDHVKKDREKNKFNEARHAASTTNF